MSNSFVRLVPRRGGVWGRWKGGFDIFFRVKSTHAIMGGQGNCSGIDLVMFTKDMSIFRLK